jgi:hypothetical protein
LLFYAFGATPTDLSERQIGGQKHFGETSAISQWYTVCHYWFVIT